MAWEQVASGNILDFSTLSAYEDDIAEGQRGWLQLQLAAPISQSLASDLENMLKQAGVEDVKVTTGSPILNIIFRKGFPWLAVIAATVLALAILAVLIVGWNLYKEVIPESAQFPVALALVGIAVLLAIGYARR